MKHLIIFLIIILGILIIKCASSEVEHFKQTSSPYTMPQVKLKHSYQIEIYPPAGAMCSRSYKSRLDTQLQAQMNGILHQHKILQCFSLCFLFCDVGIMSG